MTYHRINPSDKFRSLAMTGVAIVTKPARNVMIPVLKVTQPMTIAVFLFETTVSKLGVPLFCVCTALAAVLFVWVFNELESMRALLLLLALTAKVCRGIMPASPRSGFKMPGLAVDAMSIAF